MNTATTRVPLFSFGTLVLLVLMGIGGVAAFYRFAFGLGASTNMSDAVPWGFWVAFDVLSGVALAAGGFTITAAVYIFNMKKYKPIARPAILTAFLGYLMVVVGLIVDIGQPLRFWHTLVMPQVRSVMFEVVMCITLYTTVLTLEFAPSVFERLRLGWALRLLRPFHYPLIIAGIVLSFLHQSSLGGFFLIMPSKVPSLWYSANMPYLFYLSAICVGLAMVTFESIMSARAFKRPCETDIIQGLGKGTAIALAVYITARIADLAVRGALPRMFEGSASSMLYLAELLIGFVIPMVILFQKRIRETVSGTLFSVSLVIFGVLFNRFNTNFSAQLGNGVTYFPTWMEVAISIGIVAGGIFAYRLAALYLPVFHAETEQ
ncbi:MAG: NrfD/PsrC family molybdoenzyme membrane anchor subunit [Nitrospirota bacterium]